MAKMRVRAKKNLYYNVTFIEAGQEFDLLTEKHFNKNVHQELSAPAETVKQEGMPEPIKAAAPKTSLDETPKPAEEAPAADAPQAQVQEKKGTGDQSLI